MRRLSGREWLIIAVPVVFAASAALLQFRPGATQRLNQTLRPQTTFFAESIKRVSLTPHEVANGYDTKIKVVLNYGGPEPVWWNKQKSSRSSYNKGDKLVLQRDAKKRSLQIPVTVHSPHYDQQHKRYIAHYLLDLASLPSTKDNVVLKANLAVGMLEQTKKPVSPVVPISFIVRRAGQITRVPKVSRQSGLQVEKVLVTRLSAQESQARGGYNTQIRVVFKRQAGVGASPEFGDYAGYAHFLDEKGRDLDFNSSHQGLLDAFLVSYDKLPATRFDERYFSDVLIGLPTKKPRSITLKNTVSRGGAWPLEYKTVIYDQKRPVNFGTAAKPLSVAFEQHPAPRH